MKETLEVGGLTFEVRRSARRKTCSLTVDRGGELVIHSPETANTHELSEWTRSKMLWVHRKLAIKEELAPKVREPEFVTGESFYYLGRAYRLAIVARQEKPLRFDGNRFYLRNDAIISASDLFRDWYVTVGKEWIYRRVAMLLPRIGALPSQVEVRDLGFRWGSCGKSGVLYFNWRVLQFPVRLVDYVIVHELAHLLERHHGPEFWCVLDRALPDWRARQEELKTKVQVIHWCHASMRC
ncbi:MAG TPA: SprT family zinc-dependent metalloprotease [Bacillota bacterium]|nr:SprT family zinc-dependent metalloprotease [Bacillota bacterium]